MGGPDLFHPDRDPGQSPGRYAPSPTGRLHLGNLRTALLAWRSAREREAAFLIRIEDIDSGRSREEWVEVQLQELRQIGIDWDGVYPDFQAYLDVFPVERERPNR